METKSLNLCGGDVRQKLDFLNGSYENEASKSNIHSPTFNVGSNVISKDECDLGIHLIGFWHHIKMNITLE